MAASDEALPDEPLHPRSIPLNPGPLPHGFQQAIVRARQDDTSFALAVVGIGGVEAVTQKPGSRLIQLLLQQVEERLRARIGEGDRLAQLGPFAFAVLLDGVDDEGATAAARDIFTRLAGQSFDLAGQLVDVDPNVGVSMYAEHGHDAATLVMHATIAMETAKRAGSPYALYTADLEARPSRRLALSREMIRAVEGEQLRLHYQPLVRLSSGLTASVEALIYWQHPEHGFLPPADFLPAAEYVALLRHLNLWVLDKALYQWRLWHADGYDTVIAVNLSARSLQEARLPDTISRLLDTCEVPSRALTLEVTEAAVVEGRDRALAALVQLHDLGIGIALDDIGSDMTCFPALRDLPIDQVKIDRILTGAVAADPAAASRVQSILDVAHDLELEVVAEGVETRETYLLLAAMGCDLAQGFWLSEALEPEDVPVWLSVPWTLEDKGTV
ncbi:MAG TPA: GGDEF domain-containing phosphodiesterase [Candidatus Sulfotelmatobacter sp.]|nr:GGDEF domain-containing phosphodiesterase [Candidatus Sulfotelmatobacter sp.]